MRTLLSDQEIANLNLGFEEAQPSDILAWALEKSGLQEIAIASAFQTEGTVVIHMATQIRPDVPILFLETGFQFAETLAFKERLTEQLGLNVRDLVGEYSVDRQEAEFGARLFESNPEVCCEINKVRPMFEALRGLDAWVTSVRRDSSPTRATTPIVERYDLEQDRPIVKVNPMANWTKPQVWGYLKEHDLPHNPLYDLGYSSIGCAPCTRLRFTGEPERAGRWAGIAKWECGIHVNETARQGGASS
ncbi:MAG TPA: phosphoadenylyl-sulfate reductase [Actinomycetota bacterium]|jgi:phosphoadenosine phosphosulfate reductase|nr:phosphoadenylyl-sulfate reductase [Actinomycetota bacterium]